MKPGDPVKQIWEWAVMGLLTAAYIVNLLHWNNMSEDAKSAMAIIQVGGFDMSFNKPTSPDARVCSTSGALKLTHCFSYVPSHPQSSFYHVF